MKAAAQSVWNNMGMRRGHRRPYLTAGPDGREKPGNIRKIVDPEGSGNEAARHARN
ncbi:hypothetical protein [Pseudoscardovia radai]|uniref:hypothetical protein n=1 Tax=Pseudoscardovia radai TaxID=987066 RepID=UPI0027074415|nr:hypothetical protein [Pseudoscardovia radai]